ncbi:MAG: hypothetical protein FD180_2771 [Planctomycetota bacterium]|nr:MAG: hypothetical protein FD180_2771 [Planctomycetota bacterium]
MRRHLPALFAAFTLAACSSSNVADGDRRFQDRDFDGAVEAYGKAAQSSPGNADLERKLETARKNAATAHAERAAEAAERGELDRALSEIATALRQDSASERCATDEKKYKTLRADVAAQLERAKKAGGEEAFRVLSSIERYKATFPEIPIRLAQARSDSVKALLAAAEDFGKAGQWLKSQLALEHAQEISANQPALSSVVKDTKTNLRVMELLDQGWKLKSQGDLEGALTRFYDAVALRPDAPEAMKAAVAAKRGLSEQWIASAREAHDNGDAIAAYAFLARAEAMDRGAPGIDEIAATVRKNAAKELVAKADDASKRKLPGLEWLRLSQAKAVLPEDEALARKLADAGTKLDRSSRPLVLVKGFRNGTNQNGREVRLASEAYRLLQEMSGNGRHATVMDEDGWEVFLKENQGLTPDLMVKGTLERFDLIHHPDRKTPQFKQYKKDVTYLDLTGKAYVNGTETRTYYYDIIDRSIDGTATLAYEVYDVAARQPLAVDSLRGDTRRADRIVAGNAEAGVDEDANEIPADAELMNEMQTQLRDRLLERLRADLGWFGKKYYTAYERARDAGQMELAVSNAVMAIRSRVNAGLQNLPQDVDWVRRRTGWDMTAGKIEPENLK